MNLVFAFGADGVNARDNFNAQKEIAEKMVKSQEISEDATLIGAIVYDNDARLAFKIGESVTESSTVARIKRLERYRNGNNIKKALELARDQLLTVDITRQDALKGLVLFLDKTSGVNRETEDVAKQLKDAGVNVVLITVGNEAVGKEVLALPSDIRGLIQTSDPRKEIDGIIARTEMILKPGMIKFFFMIELP